MSDKPEQKSVIVAMANRLGVEAPKLLETLKVTAFKGATNEEMMALCIVANQYGLNPFTKEIFAFPAKGGGIQPVVSVDGWIRLMNEHPQFNGIEFDEVVQDGKPVYTTAIIYRKDREHPTRVTEWFSECYRKTDAWDTRPRRMLRHKATIQGARTAFGFAGIIDEDEIVPVVTALPVTQPRLTAPKAEAPALEEPKTSDLAKAIVEKMKASQIGEGVFMEFVRSVCPLGVEVHSVEEAVAQVPATMQIINNTWDDIAERIKTL